METVHSDHYAYTDNYYTDISACLNASITSDSDGMDHTQLKIACSAHHIAEFNVVVDEAIGGVATGSRTHPTQDSMQYSPYCRL